MWDYFQNNTRVPDDDLDWLEQYVICLDEQGMDMKWSDMLWWTDYSVDHVKEWQKYFIEETRRL